MGEYLGNVLADIERALEKGHNGITLDRAQMEQALGINGEVVAAKNELVRENNRLRRGEFTPDEFQALCHHRDERPGCTRGDFEAGCREYQEKLFGGE